MTKTIIFTSSLLIMVLITLSCDPKVDTGLKIVFSDGNIIDEQDIAFYDSSTCIFFLKKNLSLEYSTGKDNSELTEFNIQIDEEIIYNGIIWPALVSAVSPFPFYISSCMQDVFDSDVLIIKFFDFNTVEPDNRNNPDLINYLARRQLLRHGLSCSVDSIRLSTANDSSIVVFTTLKNHDKINYYLPDPEKMGDKRYGYYSNRVSIKHVSSDTYFSPTFENYNTDWNSPDMNYMTVLASDSLMSFSYVEKYHSPFQSGLYDVRYKFGEVDLCSYDQFEIEQMDGRLWVGEYSIHLNNVLIE